MATNFTARLRVARKAIVGLFSDRSAQQAYSLLAGLYPSVAGAAPQRGTRQILQSYSTMPWLRAVSQKIAQAVAATEWTLHAPTSGKRERLVQRAYGPDRAHLIKAMTGAGKLRRLDEHLLLDALAKANDFLVGPALMRTTQIHMDLVGEAFWIKERNA